MAVCPSLGSLQDIRRVAREVGVTEIQWNKTSRVIAFRGSRLDGIHPRINVWYTTGTVGTYLYHPNWNGATQLFRRNVDLGCLRDIFQNPRKHTGLGYHFREELDPRRSRRGRTLLNTSCHETGRDRSRSRSRSRGGHSPEEFDEETVVQQQMTHLLIAQQKLNQELETARQILEMFEEQRKEEKRKQEEEESRRKAEKAAQRAAALRRIQQAEKERQRELRGECAAWYNLHGDIQTYFTERCTCVAIGGNTTLTVDEDGTYSYTNGLTTNLHNKLHTRPTHWECRPNYVSLGSKDRYYVSFNNGKSEWVGCDDLSDALDSDTDLHGGIACIAFGETWSAYFMVYKDGYWEHGGDVPDGLVDILNKREKRSDITHVSLGPDGEWFLATRNGRTWWGGISNQQMNHIESLGIRNKITRMFFGDDDSYFMRYH